jgi:hypothetical protein
MTNRLRSELPEDDEIEKKLIVEEKPVKKASDTILYKFFTKGFITTDEATNALPFLLYIALLGMIYIGNTHLAERNVRDIGKINKEVKELGWDYKVSKADLAFKSTYSEIKKRVDTMGIRSSLTPPQKINVREDGQ